MGRTGWCFKQLQTVAIAHSWKAAHPTAAHPTRLQLRQPPPRLALASGRGPRPVLSAEVLRDEAGLWPARCEPALLCQSPQLAPLCCHVVRRAKW